MHTSSSGLITLGSILLLAFLSCLLLPAPALTQEAAQQVMIWLHLADLSQLYTLLFCIWFLLLGTAEFFLIRFIWRRWFLIERK